ncbi:helix-turn-helix domain-containing protein [Sphingomonas sp. RT2P30]|uniref:AraC family transcriptional regulator n=1 Tax=Parasphingomonas halimpatiens TaxID=3096162 RepID=UPI002FC73691
MFTPAAMFDGLIFGWRSALLTVVVVQLLAIATGLARTLANRAANRALAILLVVLAGIVMPWLIGFAGFYDRWRWLTFAPLSITLAVAPLLHFYIRALVTGRLPAHRWRPLAPAIAQASFLTVSFLLPMPAKQRWADVAYDRFETLTAVGTVIGLAAYGLADLRLLSRYRRLLANQRSDDQRFAARWLSRASAATLLLLPIWATYALWNWWQPIGYRGLMGLYVAIAAFALYLAVEGWRHAALPFPALASLALPEAVPTPARDWKTQGLAWKAEVRAAGWASDAELTLATLARRLGTNSGHLSRAVNEGLGMNFSTFVNRLRCEQVAAAIAAGAGDDLLRLALEAGFSSKASFNRAFRARYDMAPSAYRRHVSKDE